MKLKCPVCNSCLDYIWQQNRRFFWCDFCQHMYDLVDGKFKRITGIRFEEEGMKIFYDDNS